MPYILDADAVSGEDLDLLGELAESLPQGSAVAALLHSIVAATSRTLM